jgi:predicted dithiol-disulfide oxidoreductase (DUF899 family)
MGFPGESAEYRRAREDLLEAEIALRRHLEQVAALRRKLPLGGELPQDYRFQEWVDGTPRPVHLSQLFGDHDTLLLYSFMYGPKMEAACPMCTSLLDGLDGTAGHLQQRVAFGVVARSPIERIRRFADERGWRRLRLLSSAENHYNRDYRGEDERGRQDSGLNVFVRRDGRIHHFWHCEMIERPADPGQNQRHVDLFWPLWNLLDLTPAGRGEDWYPSLRYDE